jgi:D-lactate dehydrogenase
VWRVQGRLRRFLDFRLELDTAQAASGAQAICVFVNDDVGRAVLEELAGLGVRLLALRCAGFSNVDLSAAKELGLRVTRVPNYSPYSVAEHMIGLILALNRKLHRAFNRVRECNFSVTGLEGFDLHGKTAGPTSLGLSRWSGRRCGTTPATRACWRQLPSGASKSRSKAWINLSVVRDLGGAR